MSWKRCTSFTIVMIISVISKGFAEKDNCEKKGGTCRKYFSCTPYTDALPVYAAGLCPYWKPYCCVRAHCVKVLGYTCRPKHDCSPAKSEKRVGWYGCPHHHKHCCKPAKCVTSRQGECSSKCKTGQVHDGRKECPKERRRCCIPVCYKIPESFCREVCEYPYSWYKGPFGCKQPKAACCTYSNLPCAVSHGTCRETCSYREHSIGRLNCASDKKCCRTGYAMNPYNNRYDNRYDPQQQFLVKSQRVDQEGKKLHF